jgi:hypothetical protein
LGNSDSCHDRNERPSGGRKSRKTKTEMNRERGRGRSKEREEVGGVNGRGLLLHLPIDDVMRNEHTIRRES